MATLPQASDYGARVALRSSRVDIPGQGEMAVANALERAAGTFTQMAIEHKNKDDALSYSNAKNEYLIADIQERDKLQDDQDFSTHDERYRTAMKGHYERLFPTVRSQRDQHLFDSEARLMDERGAVAVGDNARTKEIDWHVGQFNKNTVSAQGVIMAASDAQTAQDAMFGVMEQGAALRERGYLSEEEYQASMQGFVTETAFSRLTAMDPKEREVLLERSVTMTKTKGEPITQEQISAGEGSGSIADFLPLDVRVKMLNETRKGNKHDDTMAQAYEVYDRVLSRYKDPAKVDAAIKEAGKSLDPDVRTALRTLSMQYRQDESALETAERDNVLNAGSQMIDAGNNPEDMKGENWEKLLGYQKKSLRDAWQAHMEGRQFGEFTVWSRPVDSAGKREEGMSYKMWKEIPREQRPSVTLETPEWKMSMTEDVWRTLLAEQDQIKKEQENGTQPKLPTGLTNVQMVTSALVRSGFIPQTGREVEDSEAYQRLLYEFDRATQQAQDKKNAPLNNTERNEILGEILIPMAFVDDYIFWPDKDLEDMVPIAAMSSEQRDDARLSWSKAETEVAMTSSAGIATTYKQALELMALRLGVEPDQDDYERAYFALKHDLGAEEVNRRLKNE